MSKQVFAAALFALATVTAAHAGGIGDYDSPARKAQSLRSRDAVTAELQNLRAQGQFPAIGELAQAPVVAVVPATQVALSREQVRADVTAALHAGLLPRNGEL